MKLILGIENLFFVFDANKYFLLGLVLITILFSFFIYKYTVPNITKTKKIFLTSVRSSILILVLLLLFDTSINFINKIEQKLFTYVFIDNTNSIVTKDSLSNSDKIVYLLNNISQKENGNVKYFSFGNNVEEINNFSSLKFNLQGTNFNSLYNFINKNKNEIKNVLIVSDGNINEGEDPTYYFEKLQIPIFSIGVGDTTSQKDIEIKDVIYNQFNYVNKESKIEVIILNSGFGNKNINVKLFEEDKLVSQKIEILNSEGFNKIYFTIKPTKSGEIKYRIEIDKFGNEISLINNTKIFYINILPSKIKIALISDVPSNDVSTIYNSLKKDENFQINKYYKITDTKFWIEPKEFQIDSSDILFFINFPTINTTQNELNKFSEIISKGKPYFISISNYTSLDKLYFLNQSLPLTIKPSISESRKVQPDILLNEYTSYFSQLTSRNDIWNKLAPIDQVNFTFQLKTDSKTLVKSFFKNADLETPLISIRNIGNERVFLFNGYNFWYWNFQNVENNQDFVSNFFIEIAKWLNQAKNKKYFSVTTNKKYFSQNEQIEFRAELYDQTFNPIDTSNVLLKINNDNEIKLNPIGNGIYAGEFNPETTGEYFYEASNSYYKNNYSKQNGRFFVSSIPIEKTSFGLNDKFLKQISYSTNAKYFYIDDKNFQIDELLSFNNIKQYSTTKTELKLINEKYFLIIILFLLLLEWFIRKRSGMI